MTINATILLQAFNFFIAYLLLRFLLFKPALRILNREQATRDGVRKTIEQYETVIARKEEEKKEQWVLCRAYFARNTPTLKPTVLTVRVADMAPAILPTVPEKTITVLTDEVAYALIHKVRSL